MAMINLLVSVVFFGCCFTASVFCQTITSSLEATNRSYFCPGEIVTYMCTGSGDQQISVYAPPQLPISQQILYLPDDNIGTGVVRSQVSTNLFSNNPFIVDLIVRNTSLTGLTISCVIDSQDPVERAHVLSEQPSDIDRNSATFLFIGQVNNLPIGTVYISWNANDGDYDPSHYTVELFINGISTTSIVVLNAEFPANPSTGDSSKPAVILQVPLGVEISARITATSRCGQTSNIIQTLPDRIPSGGVGVHYMLFVLASAVTVALALIV